MAAHIDGHRVFVIALDGEPAEPFESRGGRVVLGPGNRADVIVDATLRRELSPRSCLGKPRLQAARLTNYPWPESFMVVPRYARHRSAILRRLPPIRFRNE